MNPKARGRVWGRVWYSDTAVRQAHQMLQPRDAIHRTTGFRLTAGAAEETARGGSWKADGPFAGAAWQVNEWTQERTGHVSFRLAREVE